MTDFANCPMCWGELSLDAMEVEQRTYPASAPHSKRGLYTVVKRWRMARCAKGHEFRATVDGARIRSLVTASDKEDR